MRVEVEFSDLDELDYYIDERSERLEKMLKEDSRYAECRVKRQRWGGDGEFDTFVVLDDDGKELLSLDIWEVEALNDSELLSIINTNIQRESLECSGSTFLFLILMIFLAPIALMFPIMTLINPSNPSNHITIIIGIVAFLVLFLYGVLYFRRRNRMISEKHRIDLVAAQEDSTFLTALHRLSSTTYKDEWKYEEYLKRIRIVEDALGRSGL